MDPILAPLLVDQKGALYGNASPFRRQRKLPIVRSSLNSRQGRIHGNEILHNFGEPPDGKTPYAGLVADSNGVLYGTTASRGHGAQLYWELRYDL